MQLLSPLIPLVLQLQDTSLSTEGISFNSSSVNTRRSTRKRAFVYDNVNEHSLAAASDIDIDEEDNVNARSTNRRGKHTKVVNKSKSAVSAYSH